MLVLSRGCDTSICIGSDITVKVLEIHKRKVKLGIVAPSGYSVWRGELPPITDAGEASAEHDGHRGRQPCLAKPNGR